MVSAVCFLTGVANAYPWDQRCKRGPVGLMEQDRRSGDMSNLFAEDLEGQETAKI